MVISAALMRSLFVVILVIVIIVTVPALAFVTRRTTASTSTRLEHNSKTSSSQQDHDGCCPLLLSNRYKYTYLRPTLFSPRISKMKARNEDCAGGACRSSQLLLTTKTARTTTILFGSKTSPTFATADDNDNVSSFSTSTTSDSSTDSSNGIHMDSDGKCIFGQKSYWDAMYEDDEKKKDNDDDTISSSSYSWYCGWEELEPFWTMLVPHPSNNNNHNNNNHNNNNNNTCRVLIAGMGNDPTPVQMYDAGWNTMIAFDYSLAGVQCAKSLFGPTRLSHGDDTNNNIAGNENDFLYNNNNDEDDDDDDDDMDYDNHNNNNNNDMGVVVLQADARKLPFPNSYIYATLDKGTLDAIYITGLDAVQETIQELGRVTVPGGIVMCISRVMEPHVLLGKNYEDYYDKSSSRSSSDDTTTKQQQQQRGGDDDDDNINNGVFGTSPLWEVVHDGNLAFAEPNGEATIDLGADLYSFRRTDVPFYK